MSDEGKLVKAILSKG